MSHADRNNFEAVRILAAAAVIWGHAHPLTQTAQLAFYNNSVGAFAVKVFFVVSGFLVARSWWADPAPLRYLAKRSLRIFPALVVVCAVCVFFVGPWLTTLPLSEYFSDRSTWNFLTHNSALYPAYVLPGVFATNPYPSVVNGSLWSLPAEFVMYLMLPVVYALGRLWKSTWFLVCFTIALCAVSLYLLRVDIRPLPVFYGTGLASVLDAAPYFFLGAMYAQTRLRSSLDPGVALFLVGVLTLLQPSVAWLMELLLFVAVPYCVLAISTLSSPLLSRASRWGDPSYGIYLYGWPVQQMICHFVPNVSAIGNTLAALPVAILLGYASWHLIEKHALAFKPVRKSRSTAAASDGSWKLASPLARVTRKHSDRGA
jgi:peptidoglycan/LPS O-acetylase OafA/YrhL